LFRRLRRRGDWNLQNPLVIAYHLVWTSYGSWLPNDPRGSGSTEIRNPKLQHLGEVHHGRKDVQPRGSVIRDFYKEADALLEHPKVEFANPHRQAITTAFRETIERQKYTCYACAIMRDHVHLVIRKHKHTAEQMADELKHRSIWKLRAEQLVPEGHPVWISGHGWNVFLEHPDDVVRCIKYVEDNPPKAREPKQSWDFVKPYDDWPLHAGHSINSPYVKGLIRAGRYGQRFRDVARND